MTSMIYGQIKTEETDIRMDERVPFINSGGRRLTGKRDGRINIEQFSDHIKSCTSNDPY